jgi:hypothetical protein
MRMLPIQLSQVAQQAAAGGGVMRALSIQAADIGLAFGGLGVAIGTLATVAMPLAINAFSDAEDSVNQFKESLQELTEIRDMLQGTLDILSMSIDELNEKYGQAATTVREFAIELAELQYQQAISRANEYQMAIDGIGDAFIRQARLAGPSAASARQFAESLGITANEAQRIVVALENLQSAQGIDEQIAASRELTQAMEEVGISADQIDDQLLMVQTALLEAGIAGAELERVMARIRDRAAEAAAASQGILGMTRGEPLAAEGTDLLPPMPQSGEGDEEGGGGGGGGGGRTNPLEQRLERLQEQFATEAELAQQAYQEQQEILQQALEQQLITREEYNELMQEAQKRHNEKMAALDVYRHGDALARTEAFFGDMADAFASGNEEMMRISKVFGAAEALINAWRTFSQVMSDPSLPWYAKLPAAISLLGSAMQAVQAIQGVGKGGSGKKSAGGGGGGGGAQVAPEEAGPQRPSVSLTLIGEQGFTRAQIVQIAEALNDSGDDGQQLVEVRGRR